MSGIRIKGGQLDRPERMTWQFSALDDACDACRDLSGEQVVHGSERWKVLDSDFHGCERGRACRCGCCLTGVRAG